jgi:hypothetical protein
MAHDSKFCELPDEFGRRSWLLRLLVAGEPHSSAPGQIGVAPGFGWLDSVDLWPLSAWPDSRSSA